MQGIVFPGDSSARLKEFDLPSPGYGEVLLRVKASGMCGSDLHFYHGSFPVDPDVIQGHEPCGIVESVGEGVDGRIAKPGDRMMVHHYWACGSCRRCREGWPQMCEVEDAHTMAVNAHGGHSPFLVVPLSALIPLDDRLSFRAGAAIGCGTGTAWGAIKRAGALSDTTTVVFGQGPIGLSVTMLAESMGASVVAVDIDSYRLGEAQKFGANLVINSSEESVADVVAEFTGGRLADVVFETSGRASADALSVLGTFGRGVFTGLPGHTDFTTQSIYKKQWTLMTSWTMSWSEQARCADYIAQRKLPVDELFSHSWSLEDAQEAYEWLERQDAGKGVFEFDD